MVSAAAATDWGATALGAARGWPAELRTAVSICLNSHFPMAVAWGPDLVYLYNDAAIPIFGVKHPSALGQRVADVWPEAWPTIGPLLESVLASGVANRGDDLLLVLERNGFAEECYLTFSYSPIMSACGVPGGVFVTFMETTRRVLGERRQRTLGDLATQVAQRGGADHEKPFELVRQALERNPYDLPLAALYLLERAGGAASLAFCAGLAEPSAGLDARIALDDGAPGQAWMTAARCLVSASPRLLDAAPLLETAGHCGVWSEQPRQLLALPFRLPGQDQPRGFLLFGINPRAPLDATYHAFLDSVAGHVASAVAGAETIGAARERAAAMAELDRRKSEFFANASHELRTPVTLILGPLAAVLEPEQAPLAPAVREHIEMAHRNAQRLHKLVNSIMDFASIEAGRLPLRLEAADPGAITAEIAGLFRSAIEAAGLALTVRSALPSGEILLDRDMWEKILFNLLSNAFKFTLAGRIEVLLERAGGWLRLSVRDTGIGIATPDLARMFERFYRSPLALGRATEGSGVGLALVQELVRLHGGQVALESQADRGSCFTVEIPWREPASGAQPEHAQPAAAVAQRQRRAAFSDEIRRYGIDPGSAMAAPGAQPAASPVSGAAAARMRVVVVDDNRDVLRYIERLLAASCIVVSATDAGEGMAAVRATGPDLVLVDVMMPGTSGYELVRQIRADQPIHTVSVLVLSARAGEEARLEALEAGADDYLAKPFSGRELIARVRSHVQMARIRRAAVEQEGELLRQIAEVRHDLASVLEGTSDAFASLDPELRILDLNAAVAGLIGLPRQALLGRSLLEVSPDVKSSPLETALHAALDARQATSVEHFDPPTRRWFSVRCYPAPRGAIFFGNDSTQRKLAEQALRQAHGELEQRVLQRTEELRAANQLLSAVFDRAPGGIVITAMPDNFIRANAAYQQLTGYSEAELMHQPLSGRTEPEDFARLRAGRARLLAGACDAFEVDIRYRRADGTAIWVSNFESLLERGQDDRVYFVSLTTDITERKRAEAAMHASQRELGMLYDHLQTVRENERTALAREVHDQLGQAAGRAAQVARHAGVGPGSAGAASGTGLGRTRMIRLVIVDDHELIREGVKKILRSSPDLRVVGEAADLAQALGLLAQHQPDIVVLDASLPGHDGLAGLQVLLGHFPLQRVVMLSMYSEERFAVRALKAGAAAYISKTTAAEELVKAIRKVMAGGTYIGARLAELLANQACARGGGAPHEALTVRENQILALIGAGRQVKQVAAELGISVSSVNTYRSRIFRKMGLSSNAALIRYALLQGLVA